MTRLVLVLLCLLAAGCQSGRPAASEQLADVVLGAVGEPGFAGVAKASGELPLSAAAAATTARPADVKDFLEDAGYQGGYARVFARGEEFVTLLAYELDEPRGAQGLVRLVLDGLADSAAFRPFDDPGVPGSRGFVLTSRVRGAVRFCVGEWFSHRARAYAVTRCAPFVLSVPAVTGIARAQLDRAVARDAA